MPVLNVPNYGPVSFSDTDSEEQIREKFNRLTQMAATKTNAEPDYRNLGLGQLAAGAFRRSVSGLGSTVTDLIPGLVGSALGFKDYAREQLAEAEEKQKQAELRDPTAFKSYKDVEGLGGAAGYVAETLGELTPDILAMLTGAGTGAVVGKRLVTKGLEEAAKQAALRSAATTGAKVGAGAASFGLQAPETFQGIYEETGEQAPATALFYGGLQAILDTALPARIIDQLGPAGRARIVAELANRSTIVPPSIKMGFAKEIAKTGALEGGTEVLQEALGILAEQTAGAKGEFFSPKNVDRLIESGIKGAIGGTAFGAPGAFTEAARAKQEAVTEIKERERRIEEAPTIGPPAAAAMATEEPQGPEPYKTQTQMPVGEFGEGRSETAYQPSLFGIESEAPRTEAPAAPAEVEAPRTWADLDREVRGLTDLLEQQRELAAKAKTPEETLTIREKAAPIESALEKAQEMLDATPKPPDVNAAYNKYQRVAKQWEDAKEKGDFAAQEKLANKLIELRTELGPIGKQLEFPKAAYRPAGGVVETEREFLERVPLIAEGRAAAQEERVRGEAALQTESAALQRMAERTKEGPTPLQAALEERRKEEPELAVQRQMTKGRLEQAFTDQGELFPITPAPETALTPQSVLAEVAALQRMGRTARRERGETVEEPAKQVVTPAPTSFTRTFTPEQTTPEITRALITKAKSSALPEEDAAVLNRVIDKYPVLARASLREGATTRPLEEVSDWLYTTLTNVGSPESRQEQRQAVEFLLSQYDRAAQSETQVPLEAKYRPVTKNEAALLSGPVISEEEARSRGDISLAGQRATTGTTLAGKRTTVEMAPSPGEPLQTGVQKELFETRDDRNEVKPSQETVDLFGTQRTVPQAAVASSKSFDTPERFQKYMATDALRELRDNAGLTNDTVQFMSRLIEPLDAKVKALQPALQILLYGQKQAQAKGLESTAASSAATNKAKSNFDAFNTELSNELDTFDTSLNDARAKLDTAKEQSSSILRNIKANHDALETRISAFEQSNPDAAVAARAAQTKASASIEALLASREDPNSTPQERQKNAQEAITAQRDLSKSMARFEGEGGRLPAPPTLNDTTFERFLVADATLDNQRRAAAARLGGYTTALNRAKAARLEAERAQETDPGRMALLDEAADALQEAMQKETSVRGASAAEVSSYDPAINKLQNSVLGIAKLVRNVRGDIATRGGKSTAVGLMDQFKADTERGVPTKVLSEEADEATAVKTTSEPAARRAFADVTKRKEDQERAELQQRVSTGEVVTPSGEALPRTVVSPQVAKLETKRKETEAQIAAIRAKPETEKSKKEVSNLAKKVRALTKRIEESGVAGRTPVPTQAQLRAERAGQERASREETEVTEEVAEIKKTQTTGRTGQVVREKILPPRYPGQPQLQLRAESADGSGGGKSTRPSESRLEPRNVAKPKEEQEAANAEAIKMMAAKMAANRKLAKDMAEALAAVNPADAIRAGVRPGERVNEWLDEDNKREDNGAYASRDTHALPQAAYAAVEEGNVDAALAALEQNGSTPFVRELAARLRQLTRGVKLKVEDTIEHEGVEVAGIYNGKTNTVTLSREIGMTEEDFLHEMSHPVTMAALNWKPAGLQMSRRQFLQSAAASLGALKLPQASANMSLEAQERMFFNMLDSWQSWFETARSTVPAGIGSALEFSSFDFVIDSAYGTDKELGGLLYNLEYAEEISPGQIEAFLKDGGLKKLEQTLQNARSAVADFVKERTKLSEGKAQEAKPSFELNKEQQQARADLENLLEQVKQDKTLKEEYGAKDIKEFVAELLSNQNLRDRLDSRGNLLRKFIDAIMRLITGKTLSERAVGNAMQLFQPANELVNAKTAASVMRGAFPATRPEAAASVDPSVVEFVSKTVKKEASIGDKIAAFASGLYWRTAIADRWAPIEALLKLATSGGIGEGEKNRKINDLRALQTRVNMRLHEQVNQYISTAALDGVPQVEVQKDGTKLVEGRAGANLRAVSQALSKAKVGNEQFTENLFQTWLMILRAERDGVGYSKMNFDNPPTAAEAAALKAAVSKDPDTKAAFEKARTLYSQYNKDLMKFLVDAGAIEKSKADELTSGDYVPFYRELKDGTVEMTLGTSKQFTIGSVAEQPYLKELVGGNTSVLPFFSGAMQNTAMLMRMGLRNLQAKDVANVLQDMGLAKVVPGDGPANVLRFKSKGENYYATFDNAAFPKDIPAELVMQGLQGIKTATPLLVKGMAIPANILRKTITRMPLYAVRQVIRDSTHAWLTTGGDFNPVLSSLKQLPSMFKKENQPELTLERAGVISSNVFTGDTQDHARLLRDISSGKPGWQTAVAKLDEIAIKADSSTRAVIYDAFRRKGMTHAEALLGTLESMNFSRRGTSASMHWLSTMVPFFNAQIQGLDATYRAFKGDMSFSQKMDARNTLLKRGAVVAAFTVSYALLMQDDEAYKNATPEQRAANWFIRIPGVSEAVRVPIPFELGLIFKAIPEAFINVAFGDTKASEAAKTMLKQAWLSNPFRLTNLPTALKGPIEIAANYNFFGDSPIESSRERTLTSDERYRNSTTEVAKLLGKAGVLSPLQVDHLVRSYTSSMGITLMSLADFALRPLNSDDVSTPPSKKLSQTALFGSLFQPDTGRGIVDAAFDDIQKFQQANNTYKAMLDQGRSDDANNFANRFSREIALNSTGGTFRQKMGELAKQKRQIAGSPSMGAEEKRSIIDELERIEVALARRIREQATQSE